MKKILPLMLVAFVALPTAAQTLEVDDGAAQETSISSLPAEESAAQPAEEPESALQAAPAPEPAKGERNASDGGSGTKFNFARPGNAYLKGGLNLLSLASDDDESYDMDFFSPAIFLDKYFYLHQKFGVGFGIGFIYATTHDEDFGWIKMNSDDYDMSHEFIMPLYGTIKAYLGNGEGKEFYAKFDIGYSFWWEAGAGSYPYDYSVDEGYTYGGLYFGGGFGIDFQSGFNIEVAVSHLDGGIFTRYNYGGWRNYEDEIGLTFLRVTVGHDI